MGKGARVGLVAAAGDDALIGGYGGELRDVVRAIDETPILSDAFISLLMWFSEAYLCGLGTAMKALLPASFMKGELLDPPPVTGASGRHGGGVSFVYEPVDSVRFERYAEMMSDGRPTLISFPMYSAAMRFAEFLAASGAASGDPADVILRYPKSGARAEWKAWNRLASGGGARIVVGAQSSSMAPLRYVSRIIVEDESNNAWRTIRHPVYNVRSLMAKRALLEGASLVLGGRMPSSRAYMRMAAGGFSDARTTTAARRTILVDMKLAYSPEVRGMCDSLAVSEPLVRETDSALERGAWAIWILDRKGYAGEIICSECGTSIRCGKCGGAMRLEVSAGRTSCASCGTTGTVPDVCPNCSGILLSARRPGLEVLITLAKSAITAPYPVIPFAGDGDEVLACARGLVVGTRAALSLCDDMDVGMIGWIDADGEARSQEYGARARAFGLVWESLWRGSHPESRTVLIQTRRPGMEWQKGLCGSRPDWRRFWRDELREREDFNMPPFSPLIRIEASMNDAREMARLFEGEGFEFWTSDEQDSKRPVLWLRTKKLSALRRKMEPFFHIARAGRGYPSVTVWHE
jgi:primosomal protein N' (replication factor Y)